MQPRTENREPKTSPSPVTRHPSHGSAAFSLTELLVVMGLIALLASAIIVATIGLRTSAQIEATKALIARLDLAAQQYFNDYRTYPYDTFAEYSADFSTFITGSHTANTEAIECLYYALAAGKLERPYLEFKSAELDNADDDSFSGSFPIPNMTNQPLAEIVDAWGMPLRYVHPGDNNRGGVDIWSSGPDKTDDNGGNDDVKNWK